MSLPARRRSAADRDASATLSDRLAAEHGSMSLAWRPAESVDE